MSTPLLIHYPEIFVKIQEASPELQTCKCEPCNLSNSKAILLVFGYIKDESMKIDIHAIPDCINMLIKQFYFENLYEMQYISNCEVNYVDDDCLEIQQNQDVSSNHNIIISKLCLNKEKIYSFKVKVIKTGVNYNGIGIVKDPQKIIDHLNNTKNQETWWNPSISNAPNSFSWGNQTTFSFAGNSLSSLNNNNNNNNNDANNSNNNSSNTFSWGTATTSSGTLQNSTLFNTNNNTSGWINNNSSNSSNNASSFNLNNNNKNATNANTSNNNSNNNNSSSDNATTNNNRGNGNDNSNNNNSSISNIAGCNVNTSTTNNASNSNNSVWKFANLSTNNDKASNSNNNNNNNSSNNAWSWGRTGNNNSSSYNNINRLGTKGWIFQPHTGSNINSAKLFYQHIGVGNDTFQNKSTDELRYEDEFNEYSSKGNDIYLQNDNNNDNSTACSFNINNDDTQNNSAMKTIKELNERILQLEQQLIAKEIIIQNKDKQIADLKNQLNSNNKINDNCTTQSFLIGNVNNNKNDSTKPQSQHGHNEDNTNGNNTDNDKNNNVKTGWTWNQSENSSSNNDFGDFTSSTQWSGTWNRNNANHIDNNSGWNFGSLTRNNFNNNTNNNTTNNSSWSWNTNASNTNNSSSFNWGNSSNNNTASNNNTTSNWSWGGTNYNGRDDQLYYEFENYSDGDLCEMIIYLKKSPNKSTLTFYNNGNYMQHKVFTIKDDAMYYPYICWSNTKPITWEHTQNTNNDNINSTENAKFKLWY